MTNNIPTRKKVYKDKICKFEGCNNNFTPTNSTSYFCGEDHSVKCINCENIIFTKTSKYFKNCAECRKEHSKKARLKTMMEKYNVTHVSQIEEVKKLKEESSLKKYGVKNPSQSLVVKEKKKMTCLKNYNVDNPSKSDEIKQKKINSFYKKYSVDNPMKDPKVKMQSIETFNKNLHLGKKYKSGKISKINYSYRDALEKQLKTEVILEKRVETISFDLYLPQYNIAIDINPTFTHNLTKNLACFKNKCSGKQCSHKKTKYKSHQDRAIIAMSNDLSLIQVYDWSKYEDVIELLKLKMDKTVILPKIKKIETVSENLVCFHLKNELEVFFEKENNCWEIKYKENFKNSIDLSEMKTEFMSKYKTSNIRIKISLDKFTEKNLLIEEFDFNYKQISLPNITCFKYESPQSVKALPVAHSGNRIFLTNNFD